MNGVVIVRQDIVEGRMDDESSYVEQSITIEEVVTTATTPTTSFCTTSFRRENRERTGKK